MHVEMSHSRMQVFFFSFFFCKDISDVLQINSGQPGLQGAELADT